MGTKQEIAKNIIIGLGVVGVVSAVVIAPGLAKAIPLLSKINARRMNQEINRLKKRGLVELIKRKNNLTEIKLTKEGRQKLLSYKIDNLSIEIPKKWDKIWRVIIFDVPVIKNTNRTKIRKKIKSLGFYRLQNSVFIYPYPCYEVVTFLREYFQVKEEVEYLEVQNLESQNRLISHFFGNK